MEKLIVAKQASELHSNYFSQGWFTRLEVNDVDSHYR
jgi:hypothetical protein